MIDCSISDKEWFINYYEKKGSIIIVYFDDGKIIEFDNDADTEEKILGIMELQKRNNIDFLDKRKNERKLAVFSSFVFMFSDIYSACAFCDNQDLFSTLFLGVALSASMFDCYVLNSRNKYINQCYADAFYLNYKDYFNRNINNKNIIKRFESLEMFRKENGRLEINANNIDSISFESLFDIKEVIDDEREKIRKR